MQIYLINGVVHYRLLGHDWKHTTAIEGETVGEFYERACSDNDLWNQYIRVSGTEQMLTTRDTMPVETAVTFSDKKVLSPWFDYDTQGNRVPNFPSV
jgi:hypothetical protein